MVQIFSHSKTHLKEHSVRLMPKDPTIHYTFEILAQNILQALQEGTVGPVVLLVNNILLDAIEARASDIHLEPDLDHLRVRYRIDGHMIEKIRLPIGIWSSMGVRLKVLSNIPIGDSLKPQTGRFSLFIEDQAIDFRVSLHPIWQGENMVIRILDRAQGLVSLEQLGFPAPILQHLLKLIQKPEGLFIMTGPTGAGKTTTLYALLQYLNTSSVNIMTLEQPMEYQLPSIRQTEIREEEGMTFVEGVRSILRQDPDIILIGEIRDPETAAMALRAVMTGHRVFTTLHTNDAYGAIRRLEDLGLPSAHILEHLVAIMAQRLVRRLCSSCKEPYTPNQEEQKLLQISPMDTLYQATGCKHCHETGYYGRIPLIDLLPFEGQDPTLSLQQRKQGLWSHGKAWILESETTLSEILGVVHAPL